MNAELSQISKENYYKTSDYFFKFVEVPSIGEDLSAASYKIIVIDFELRRIDHLMYLSLLNVSTTSFEEVSKEEHNICSKAELVWRYFSRKRDKYLISKNKTKKIAVERQMTLVSGQYYKAADYFFKAMPEQAVQKEYGETVPELVNHELIFLFNYEEERIDHMFSYQYIDPTETVVENLTKEEMRVCKAAERLNDYLM